LEPAVRETLLVDVSELRVLLRAVPDFRKARGLRHDLVDVLFLALVATLAGADDAEAIEEYCEANIDWLGPFVELRHGLPSQDTYLRVFAALEPGWLQDSLVRWVEHVRGGEQGGHIRIDGKAPRRGFDAAGGKGIHLLSAFPSHSGLSLGQVKVADKANEIVAIPVLLDMLKLRDVTITIDAMGCQTAIAERIVAGQGHYVLAVKGNQPELHKDVKSFFHDARRVERPANDPPPVLSTHTETDAGHGRVEVRTTTLTTDRTWVQSRARWKGLAGIAKVERERTDKRTGKTTRQTAYFIFSDPNMTARRLANLVREHWSIENRLHWVLDMAFDEDRRRVRIKNAAENFALLRRFVMNLLRTAPGKKKSMSLRRKRCGWEPAYILAVLTGQLVSGRKE
jgi:predicted transposase YbfD/YdcC